MMLHAADVIAMSLSICHLAAMPSIAHRGVNDAVEMQQGVDPRVASRLHRAALPRAVPAQQIIELPVGGREQPRIRQLACAQSQFLIQSGNVW